jgi:hypothetical protein
MAATPERSLKRRLAGTVEGRTPRFLLGSLALAMVISLLAGIGFGMKLQQHRDKNTTTRTVTSTTKPAVKPVRGTLKGSVLQVTANSLTLSSLAGHKVLAFAPATAFEVTAPATASAIVRGSRVLITLRPKVATTTSASTATTGASNPTVSTAGAASPAVAQQIIVVSGKATFRLGRTVTSVTAGSITYRLDSGKALTVSTAGATILKTVKGTKANLQKGRRVFARTFLSAPKPTKTPGVLKRVLSVSEVIVLPAGRPVG